MLIITWLLVASAFFIRFAIPYIQNRATAEAEITRVWDCWQVERQGLLCEYVPTGEVKRIEEWWSEWGNDQGLELQEETRSPDLQTN